MSRVRHRRAVTVRGHPLTVNDKRGRAPEHRLVLWDKLNGKDTPCHWCGRMLYWRPGVNGLPDTLIADHLDGDDTNNHPDNLVPACRGCNGNLHRRNEPVTVVCIECGLKFGEVPHGGYVPIYCSRSCAKTAYWRGWRKARELA